MKFPHLLLPLISFALAYSPAIAAEAEPNPFDFEPNPAIWKISDEDTTVYMFGTIHLLPKDLKWRTAKFDDIVKTVDELIVETSDADFEKMGEPGEFPFSFFEGPEKAPLLDRVKPENQAMLLLLATFIDVPLPLLDAMPTWIIPFLVYFKSIEGAEEAGEYGSAFGVETVLEAEFADMKKPVLSIEQPSAILEALSNLPDAEQITFVDELLDEWRKEGFDSASATDTETPDFLKASEVMDFTNYIAWAKGEVETLEEGLTKEDLGEGFYDILITKRNAAWAEWLTARLEKPGTLLLAVGAGHFAGEDALQGMLAAKGLRVERIQ